MNKFTTTLTVSFLFIFFLSACNNRKGPDVSGIKIKVQTLRFEKDFFEIDSTLAAAQYGTLLSRYPSFAANFLTTIINADPRWAGDTLQRYLRGFMAAYRPVYDTAEKVFSNFTKYENEIVEGLKHVKYYYPQYKIPAKIITYIGPLDGYGDILDKDAIIVGLHHHLGEQYSLYNSIWVRETYPDYITRRFVPRTIAVNAMKNIVTDMYPENNEDKTLILQMISKGKQLYMLQQLLPEDPEYNLIGYTQKQMDESYGHEAAIWDLFVQNNFLQSRDNNIIKNYIGDSPKTQELGEASPGNIGAFTGWQIVKKYMSVHEETTLPDLMKMDEEKILSGAKYKP